MTKPILQSPPEIDLFTSYRYHWSPDQQYLVSIHNDQSLRLWNSQTMNQIGVVNNLTGSASAAESVGIYEQFSDVHFDLSGNFILTTALDGAVRKWKLPFDGTGSELISQVPVAGGIQLQEISPKAKYVATSYGDGSKILWEIESGKIVKELVQPYSDSLTGFRGLSMNFSSDGSCLALTSGNNDKTLTLKSIPDGNTIANLTGHASAIRSAIFSQDGGLILTVSEDGTAKVWAPHGVDPNTTRQLANAHDDIVFQIDLDASGKILLTGSYDGTARIWDLGRKQLIATHEGHDSEIVAVDLTADGKKGGDS